MNWKKEFRKNYVVKSHSDVGTGIVGKEFGDSYLHWKPEAIESFISTQLEKLIADIPDDAIIAGSGELEVMDGKIFKKQLRERWLER